MTEFYEVKNETTTLYFATRDMPTLLAVLQNPRNAMALGLYDSTTVIPLPEQKAQRTQNFNNYLRQGLRDDGTYDLGDLEQEVWGTEDDIIVEKIPMLDQILDCPEASLGSQE
jgi:hypothetical protein